MNRTPATPTHRTGLHMFGVPVTVSSWWVVIFAVLTMSTWGQARADLPGQPILAAVVAAFFPTALFLSVLIHEASHAVVGRLMGQPPTVIAITLLGGHTEFDQHAPNPKAMAVTAASGPASNLIIGVVSMAVLSSTVLHPVGENLLSALALTNILVALLNAMPGVPLDGGQVLAAAVWKVTGNRDTGWRVGAWSGLITGAGLAVVGFVVVTGITPLSSTFAIWLIFIGVLVATQAWGIIRADRVHRRVATMTAQSLAVPASSVGDTATVADVERAMVGSEAVFVVSEGVVRGVIRADVVQACPPDRRSRTLVSAVMATVVPHPPVPGDVRGAALVGYLGDIGGGEWAVGDQLGRVTGLVTAQSVNRAVGG